MKQRTIAAACLSALMLVGCSSHLLFVEEDHLGLKAKFEGNNPAPAELSLGYHRGIVAMIPQQSDEPSGSTSQASVTRTGTGTNTVITITHDPDELMSLYTIFRANVGLWDPVETHHFLATGTAASSLLANHNELREITKNLKGFNGSKGGGQ
ncbi:MAG: hypothetical protein A2107_00545 [Verrucomicrobia bacterium GWF2_62_7]|nr:MAG: hypothetical protein A2107_00545 [Verrucomicrobia bacterium GWF2_62_7]